MKTKPGPLVPDSLLRGVLSKYLKTVDSEWYKHRLAGVMFCIMTAFVVLFARLFYLQVIKGNEFRQLSENNSIRLQNTEAPRGLIFDRKGKLLVDNRPSFDLIIIVKDAKSIAHTIEKLSRYVKVPEKDLMSKIEKNNGVSFYRPVMLKQDIGRDTLGAIEVHKFDLPGVEINVKPRRHYVNKHIAAHLIGYLGEINANELKSKRYLGYSSGDFIGKFGVEKVYEQFLKGKHGGRQVEVNVTGQIVRILQTVHAKSGHNIFLTIDLELQKKAEALLNGVAGAAVAMEPTTGRILAMASSPSFDQNVFVSGLSHEEWNSLVTNPLRPMENKAVQAEYPPASVYKIVTAIAGLEEGVIDEKTTFYCPGHYRLGNHVFRCWKKGGHGSIKVVRALTESCDVFFYQVGQKVGIDRLAWYAKACGLGSTTGINLDQESKGLVPNAAWKKQRTGIAWQGGETLSVAIGQSYNLVTPLQMLVLLSAVANDGIIYKPLILKTIETDEGKILVKSESRVIGNLPASSPTLQIVKRGLWEVVNNRKGTARIARVAGIEISGKTGTAQVVSSDIYETASKEEREHNLKPHAWFVAYAPSDDPQIAVAVIVEHGEHSSSTAVPIVKELIKTYLSNDKPGNRLKAQRGATDLHQGSNIYVR